MNKHEQETQQKTQEERRTKQKNKNQKTRIRKNTDLAQCTYNVPYWTKFHMPGPVNTNMCNE